MSMNAPTAKMRFSFVKPVLLVAAIGYLLMMAITVVEFWRLAPALSFWTIISPSDQLSVGLAMEGMADMIMNLLAVTITVVAIVVQLAAQRYTPKITDLFLKDPVNVAFFMFMVVGGIFILAVRGTFHAGFIPTLSAWAVLGIITINIALLPVYMRYVFSQIQPDRVIRKITDEGIAALSGSGRKRTVGARQRELIHALDIVSDIAINSITQGDRGQALRAVDSLGEIFQVYLNCKRTLPGEWAQVSRDEFFTISDDFFSEITRDNKWVEAKILMELEMLFEAALATQANVISKIATVIRNAGYTSIEKGYPAVIRMETTFFNNFCRQAITKGNLRAIYTIFYHYRLLTERLVDYSPEMVVNVAEFLKYYGQLANSQGMPFALVIAASDLSVICERAFERNFPEQHRLLDVFIQLDEDPDDPQKEKANRGVRKAQAILGSFYLQHGQREFAQVIARDMIDERPDRLESILTELLSVQQAKFWEVTDRGINFEFVSEERRPHLIQFFEEIRQSQRLGEVTRI